MQRRSRGLTLPELIVTVAFVSVVAVCVGTLFMQTGRIYASTSVHFEPQASLMLGMKRMERELREAMFIRVGSSSTAVEVALPQKDDSARIKLRSVEIDPVTHKLALVRMEGRHVCYFLGRTDPNNSALAIPDPVNGNTIFRVTTGTDAEAGTAIISSGGVMATSYANARVIITGIFPRPLVPNPSNRSQDIETTIFAYATNGVETSTFQDGVNAQIVRITLTSPVAIVAPGKTKNSQTLTTQFCLRNFESLN